MKINILSIGRSNVKSPEYILTKDYINKINLIGKNIGFLCDLLELEIRNKKSKHENIKDESKLLEAKISNDDYIICLDENGNSFNSREFAMLLSTAQNNSYKECKFIIGGANGLDSSLKSKANKIICFGKMTWPHMLARVMLSEQLYRAMTIMTNHPYHKD